MMTDKTNDSKHFLVTGAAGFIGFHYTSKLLNEGCRVIAVDNLNDYYDVHLKYARLKRLGLSQNEIDRSDCTHPIKPVSQPNLSFYRTDVKDKEALNHIFKTEKPAYVVHLAAQVGVRYSIENPYAYIDSNIIGFMNILENCRNYEVKHMVFSSSSSVYGANRDMPYSERHNTDYPVSLYAATKKSNELMAHSYAHLFKIPTTGLRFFTVYGPWGRPDMAYFTFTDKIMKGLPIDVFNHGKMKRDFTYIDDIVEGIFRVALKIPDPASSSAPYRIFNIGNNRPVELLYFIELIEKRLGKKAIINFLPMQKGDTLETCANIDALHEYTGFKPGVSIEDGMTHFIKWYQNDYGQTQP